MPGQQRQAACRGFNAYVRKIVTGQVLPLGGMLRGRKVPLYDALSSPCGVVHGGAWVLVPAPPATLPSCIYPVHRMCICTQQPQTVPSTLSVAKWVLPLLVVRAADLSSVFLP